MIDYYKVLGVKKDSSKSKIKKAFRQFGFKWHPDMRTDNKDEAKRRFQKICEAYEVLTNDRYKKVYDSYYEDRSVEGKKKFSTINLNSQFNFRIPEELFRETFGGNKRNVERDGFHNGSNEKSNENYDKSHDRLNENYSNEPDKQSDEPSIDQSNQKANETVDENVNSKDPNNLLTRAIGMDCEMVGVGEQGKQSVLARVSLVNQFGNCIYDKYVKPLEPVTDYRTSVSGIRPEDIANGEDFKTVQKEVYDIVSPKNRILVGHALRNDLRVLILDHIIPKSRIRDTAIYFKKMLKGKTPSLKRLTSQLLGANIQCGEHDSVQDAKAAMMLYTMYKKKWENGIKGKHKLNNQLLNK